MRFKAKLAYCIFLSLAERYLDFFEEQGIPFVFTLYPGGTFFLGDAVSDRKLTRVLKSPMFMKVITTQRLVTDYLLEHNFCAKSKIFEVIGGVMPAVYEESAWDSRQIYGRDKDTIDICFVAYKYSKKGIDKGYDQFIEVAHRVAAEFTHVYFHIVGGFTAAEIDVSKISDRIRFYGSMESERLCQFYKSMDLILSPNINNHAQVGRFDGFPTGACIEAGMSGVAVFCTDPLNQNVLLESDKNFVLLEYSVEKIFDQLCVYLNDPNLLYRLAEEGQRRFRECFGVKAQLGPRMELLSDFLSVEMSASEVAR